ncbi:GntR family transcriptional regulator [Kitasatospora sp. NPDC057015]|uniref:GntR family transcriptional regulator n=1 Tax=Kitasatospora sp. NPDC057015 TaxID=3346001 RepID=UPI00362D1413
MLETSEVHGTSGKNRYQVIARHLRADIRSGRIPAGARLPAERALAADWNVNRQTVRAALRVLREDGLVESHPTGTYASTGVTAPPSPPELPFPGSMVASHEDVVTVFRTHFATPAGDVAAVLGIPPDEPALAHQQRVHDVEGHLLQDSRSHFAPELIAELPELERAAGTGQQSDLTGLYGWMLGAGLRLTRYDRINVAPDHGDVPHLAVRRVVHDHIGRPLAVTDFRVVAAHAELEYRTSPLDVLQGDPRSVPPVRAADALAPLRLTGQERAALLAWLQPGARTEALAQRARIVLACDDAAAGGVPVAASAVARRLHSSKAAVEEWHGRFLENRVEGLLPRRGRGRPRSVTDAQVADVLARTRYDTPPDAPRWTKQLMAAQAGLSASTISRIWRAHGVSPAAGAGEAPVRRAAAG